MVKPRWYEKYLPFVAQSPEKQFVWLKRELLRSIKDQRSGRSLTLEEIQPYVRLFLEDDDIERRRELTSLLKDLDSETVGQMLRAADIYDATTLFGLLAQPDVDHVQIVLLKEPPSHEKKPHMITDKLFLAVHNKASEVMESAVESMNKTGETSKQFDEAYTRFKEMLMDEEVLSLLFPKAKA